MSNILNIDAQLLFNERKQFYLKAGEPLRSTSALVDQTFQKMNYWHPITSFADYLRISASVYDEKTPEPKITDLITAMNLENDLLPSDNFLSFLSRFLAANLPSETIKTGEDAKRFLCKLHSAYADVSGLYESIDCGDMMSKLFGPDSIYW